MERKGIDIDRVIAIVQLEFKEDVESGICVQENENETKKRKREKKKRENENES